jgi:hypothetical protein
LFRREFGSCKSNPTTTPPVGATNWDVVVKRNAGTATMYGLKLIFEDATGASVVNSKTVTIPELGTQGYTNEDEDGTTNNFIPAKLKVAAVVGTAADQKTCDVIAAPVNCA